MVAYTDMGSGFPCAVSKKDRFLEHVLIRSLPLPVLTQSDYGRAIALTAYCLLLTSSVPPSRTRPNNTGDDGHLARAWRAVLWPKQLPYRSDSNRDRNSASIARLID